MKFQLKRVWFMVIISIEVLMMTGCNGIKNTPGEDQIIEDLRREFPSESIELCDVIEVQRSQLLEEEKRWLVDVVIGGQDEYATLEAILSLEYDFYDDQGWMLDVENSDAVEIYAKEVLEQMSEDDMIFSLNNFDDSLDFVSGIFEQEEGVQNIYYEKDLYDTGFFDGLLKGYLQCSYINTDSGWQVINNYEDEPITSISTQNVLGKYQGIYDGMNSEVIIDIQDISEDGKKITFTLEGDMRNPSLGSQIFMYSGGLYQAELDYAYFPSESPGEEYSLRAAYNILNANEERLYLHLVERKEDNERASYITINYRPDNAFNSNPYLKIK